jgi:hypothetical protein
VKEEVLEKLEVFVQDTKKYPYISTTEYSTMIEANMVNYPSKTISQETFANFEKNNRGIGSNIMRQIGYYGRGIDR